MGRPDPLSGGSAPPSPSFTGSSARPPLPAHLSENLQDLSWDTLMDMGGDFSARSRTRTPALARLEKEVHLSRLLLMERAREQHADGALDPRLLADTVRLLERCEDAARQHQADWGEFNAFLQLVLEKVKKSKLARHDGPRAPRSRRPFSPHDWQELERLKGRSEGHPARR